MRFLCIRLCSKSKTPAVHEPTLPEEKPTVVENSDIRDGPSNTPPGRNSPKDRKISIDQYSHVFIDEYASSSAQGSDVDSERNC